MEELISTNLNWGTTVTLEELVNDEIIKLERGRVISSIEMANNPGIYPVYSSSSQKNGLFGHFGEFDFEEELITWSVDGGGAFFYRPKHKFSVTNVSGVLKILDQSKYNYKFLYYLLSFQHSNQTYDYVDKAHPSVIKKRYYIPSVELTEQKKIVNLLDTIDNAIVETTNLLIKYKKIKSGIWQDLLSKGIDKNGDIRSEETHEFINSVLGKIPKEWKLMSIEDYSEKITSGSRGWAKYYSEEGSKFIRIGNLKRGQIEIDLTDVRYVNLPTKTEGVRSQLKVNDMLISITADLGIVGVIPKEFGEAYINQHIALVRFKQGEVNPRFIGYFLSSNAGKKMFDYYNDSGAKAGLNLNTIGKLNILVPDLEEQDKIVSILDNINALLTTNNSKLEKYKKIKFGLMKDIFTGKINMTELKLRK